MKSIAPLRLCVFALISAVSVVTAQDGPRLRADVRTLIPRPRSGAWLGRA